MIQNTLLEGERAMPGSSLFWTVAIFSVSRALLFPPYPELNESFKIWLMLLRRILIRLQQPLLVVLELNICLSAQPALLVCRVGVQYTLLSKNISTF